MMRVIVNADDLGISQKVNQEVERLHQLGVLTSATVMATGPMVSEVPALQSRNPKLGLGIHLNSSNFRALTPGARESELCDEHGVFHLDFRKRFRFGLTKVLVEEWVAQVNLLREMGVNLRHMDSHHHVHTHPLVLPALLEVVKQTGLTSVRNTRNLVPQGEKKGMSATIKYSGKAGWSALCKLAGLKMTTSFCSVADVMRMQQNGDELDGHGTLELMCHPGDAHNEEYVAESEWMKANLLEWCGDGKTLMTYGALFDT